MPAGRSDKDDRRKSGGGGHRGVSRVRGQINQPGGEGVEKEGEGESLATRVSESYGAVRDGVNQSLQRAGDLVVNRPMESVLVAFGLGFGFGVVLTSLLAPPARRSWYERYVPESVSRRVPNPLSRR